MQLGVTFNADGGRRDLLLTEGGVTSDTSMMSIVLTQDGVTSDTSMM